MSARNPTDYNAFNDETGLILGSPILSAVPSAVVNDQTFFLDQSELVISDCFPPILVTEEAVTLRTYYLELKDMCRVPAAGASVDAWLIVYAKAVAVGSSGTVGLQSALTAAPGNAATVSIPTGGGWAWRKAAALMTIATDEVEDALTFAASGNGGSGHGIYVAGLALFAVET